MHFVKKQMMLDSVLKVLFSQGERFLLHNQLQFVLNHNKSGGEEKEKAVDVLSSKYYEKLKKNAFLDDEGDARTEEEKTQQTGRQLISGKRVNMVSV